MQEGVRIGLSVQVDKEVVRVEVPRKEVIKVGGICAGGS